MEFEANDLDAGNLSTLEASSGWFGRSTRCAGHDSYHPASRDLLDESARCVPATSGRVVPGRRQPHLRCSLRRSPIECATGLWQLGVRPGDRVGLRLAQVRRLGVATIFGILKAGAAYVPVDAESPAARGAYILNNCQVKAVFTEAGTAPAH